MPAFDFYSPELIRKAIDAVEEEESRYPNFSSDARRALFNQARDEGSLDDLAAEEIATNRDLDLDNDYINPEEIRNYYTVQDFRDEIPFNGLEVDPDYERYTAYRLASQDPKARRFFLDYLQNNPDTPTSRVSSQVYQDSATGRLNRRDLASLHNSFESRLLNDQNPSFDEWNTANFIEREGTGGRSLGLDQDIYEGFTAAEEDLNRLRNIADLPVNLESQRRSLRERINSNFNQISRLGDPLFNPELSDQLNRINSRIPSETVPATLRDALDQNNLLNELNRNLNDFNPTSPYLRRTMAREDYASNVIPSVRKALGEQASIDAAMQDYNNYKAEMNKQNKAADNSSVAIAQRANRQAASMPPGQQRQLINRALENRGQENLSEITIEEPRDNVTGYIQKSIPGLKENLSKNLNDIRLERGKESIEELKKIIQEFPELKDLVYGVTNENPRQRVKPEAFKPYTKYADTQQRISTPADRAALYNTIITSYNDPDLKRINADTLESAEKLYVSGDPSSQETARLIIQQQGFEEQLNKIQQNSFRPQRPIVGGGGYVEPYNSLEPDVKDLVNRIDTRATKFNSALSKARSFLGSNLIEQQFPGLASSSSDLPTEAAFNFDPDTKEVTPAAIGERGAYAVRVSPADPKSFLVKKLRDLYLSSGVSKNVLKFLADYPVTGTASISFDTRKPYESWADYHAIADLPKEITDKFEQFVRGRAMAGTRPGTLVSNSPLSSSDLLDERLREGETEDTSSTVRKLAPFSLKGAILPNLRGSAYMSGGFGPVLKSGNQAAYVDLEGNVIPLQPTQAELPLRGYITKRNERFNVEQDVLPLSSTPRYFSLDPISATALGALQKGQDLTEWWNLGRNTRIPNESNASWRELLRDDRSQLTRTDAAFEAGETGLKGIRPLKAFTPNMIRTGPTPAVRQAFERPIRSIVRNPGSLLPGLSDLIPSPEAIQTGYKQGPVAMGKQMGREFVQSLPTGAAFAGALSTPALAPFAPGVGLGFVGSAAVNAANEVIRQETGEGIVPKARQFIGTAPRTNVAGKPRMAEAPLTAEIKPLSAQGKAEMNRRQNRNELQKRMELAGERFNPRRGEFGLSEILFGR